MKNNYFSLVGEDVLELILVPLILNDAKTFGHNSTNNVIKIILFRVCYEWKTFLSKHKLVINLCSGKKIFNTLPTNNSVQQLLWLDNIWKDCTGFSKMSINWSRINKSKKSEKKHIGDLMTFNNFDFDEKNSKADTNSEIIRWIGCVKRLNHINIAKLLSFGIDDSSIKFLYEGTDVSLNYLIFKSYTSSSFICEPLDNNLIKSIMYQLLTALEYCHSLNICQGNLAPFRILFKQVPEGLLLKLVDFKHSPSFVTRKDIKDQPIMPSYRSPELHVDNIYTTKNDIWASGMMMFLMSSGQYVHWMQLGMYVLQNHIKSLSIQKPMKELLLGLLRPKYKLRYTASKALKHYYFDNIFKECKVVSTYLSPKQLKIGLINQNVNQNLGWVSKPLNLLIDKSNDIFRTYFHSNINSRMWSILIEWLIEVCLKIKYDSNTLTTATNYIYRYLSYVDINRSKLQLAGCAALYLASLWSENIVSPMSDYVFLSDKCFDTKQLSEVCKDMIIKLEGQFYVLTMSEILNTENDIIYNKHLMKWLDMLCLMSQINSSLIMMDNKLLLYNIIFIIDILNELITGKSNKVLRLKIFSEKLFKESHKQFISNFISIYKNCTPYKEDKISTSTESFTERTKKCFEEYSNEVPLTSLLKRFSNNKSPKSLFEKCSELLNNEPRYRRKRIEALKSISNTFTGIEVSMYTLTSAIIIDRLKNINNYPITSFSDD